MYWDIANGGSNGKESACSARDPGSISDLGSSPGKENGYPLQYSHLENRQKNLAGYRPWGDKELDMTKQVTLPLSHPVSNVVIVSGEHQRNSAIHIHVSILP